MIKEIIKSIKRLFLYRLRIVKEPVKGKDWYIFIPQEKILFFWTYFLEKDICGEWRRIFFYKEKDARKFLNNLNHWSLMQEDGLYRDAFINAGEEKTIIPYK